MIVILIKHTFILFSFLLIFKPLTAQITAGSVPPGTFVFDPGISLSMEMIGIDSADIDVDCDGIGDFRILLTFGAPPSDLPHTASMKSLDPALMFCRDTLSLFPTLTQPIYYDFEEVMDCSGDLAFVSELVLGYFGCLCPNGSIEENNRYVHYQFGSEEGWIKLSFNLSDPEQGHISLTIHEVLRNCMPTSIEPAVPFNAFRVYPNPVSDSQLYIDGAQNIRNIIVYGSEGRLVQTIQNPGTPIIIKGDPGIYFLKIQTQEGTVLNRKIMIAGSDY